jgi:F-type H+-transporting ATPase subunit gamma
MAKPRAILNRAKSVKSIAKITGTMEKIATARFKKAFQRAVAARPYTDRLSDLIQELSAAAESFHHPLLEKRDGNKVALLTVASNRGLCGGYNSNVARLTHEAVKAFDAEGKDVDLIASGKRIITMLRYRGVEFADTITDIDDRPTFEQVDAVATPLMEAFVAGKLDALYVAYTKFESASRQTPVVEQVLPMSRPATPEAGEAAKPEAGAEREWIFSPDPESILAELLPRSVRLKVFQAFLDAGVSEQAARKVAMKNATDNANDLIRSLTQKYNRSRQALITTELSEIIGGAAALS